MSNRPPSHQLAEYLATTLGLALGEEVFTNVEPPSPDTAVTLYDTGGEPPMLYGPELLRVPTIQVRVRHFDYGTAYNVHQSIFEALNAIVNQTIDGNLYVGVWASSEILSLGEDENNRIILTANYRIERS